MFRHGNKITYVVMTRHTERETKMSKAREVVERTMAELAAARRAVEMRTYDSQEFAEAEVRRLEAHLKTWERRLDAEAARNVGK